MKNVFKIAVAVAVLVAFLAPLAPALAQTQKVAEERSGVVLKISGRNVIVRNDKGEVKMFTNIPEGVVIYMDGKPVKFSQLRENMKYTAVRMENVPAPVTVTMSEVEKMPSTAPAAAPAPEPAPVAVAPVAAAPAPAAEPAPAKKLPPTGSALPLLAGLGVGLLGVGLALRRR